MMIAGPEIERVTAELDLKHSPDLLVLDARDIMDTKVAENVRHLVRNNMPNL